MHKNLWEEREKQPKYNSEASMHSNKLTMPANFPPQEPHTNPQTPIACPTGYPTFNA